MRKSSPKLVQLPKACFFCGLMVLLTLEGSCYDYAFASRPILYMATAFGHEIALTDWVTIDKQDLSCYEYALASRPIPYMATAFGHETALTDWATIDKQDLLLATF